MTQNIALISVNTGKVRTLENYAKPATSAIIKQPTKETLYLSHTNLAGDEQADLVFHGGREKAVCVYSFEHYPYWEKELRIKMPLGAFGENLTLQGLTEEVVCIGDTFEWGDAVVQVSQPRRPCYKISARYNIPELTLKVVNTGYTGFYLRVLEEGKVSVNEPLTLKKRHGAGVTVDFVNQITHHDKDNTAGIRMLLELDVLADSWRESLAKRHRST